MTLDQLMTAKEIAKRERLEMLIEEAGEIVQIGCQQHIL